MKLEKLKENKNGGCGGSENCSAKEEKDTKQTEVKREKERIIKKDCSRRKRKTEREDEWVEEKEEEETQLK